jgi:hypothetical protein
VVLWAGLAGLSVWWHGRAFLHAFRPPDDRFMDFMQEWVSARNLLAGLPVYMDQKESLFLHTGARAVRSLGLFMQYNAHPPPSIWLAVPFARLDYPSAHLAWDLVMCLTLPVTLALLGVRLGRQGDEPDADRMGTCGVFAGLAGLRFSPWVLLPAVALLLVCNPFFVQVLQGQLDLVLLLLIVAAWALDRAGRPWLAGAAVATAAAVKLFPGFLFLYFLLRRDWRALLSGALTFAALSGVTALFMGLDAYRTYAGVVVPGLEKWQSSWINDSFLGFWSRLLAPRAESQALPLMTAPRLCLALVALCDLVVLLLLGRLIWRARTRADCDRAFALSVTAMLLVSPITWEHYFLLLLLPVAWLWLHLPAEGPARWAFRAAVFVLWLPPSWFFALVLGRHALSDWMSMPAAAPWQTLTAISLPFYALLTLFVLGVVEAHAAQAAAGEPPADHFFAREERVSAPQRP